MKNDDVFKAHAYPFGTSFMYFTGEFIIIKIKWLHRYRITWNIAVIIIKLSVSYAQ